MTVEKNIQLDDVTKHNVMMVKKVNDYCLPVLYSDTFYRGLVELGDLCKLAYCNDVVVGAVTCRVRPFVNEYGLVMGKHLNVMSLATLPMYRGMGVGTMLMRYVIEMAECKGEVDAVSLNVQVTNERAIAFYQRLGFQQVYRRVDYYEQGIQPTRDAYHMVRPIKTKEEMDGGAEKEKSVVELLALNCRLSDGKLSEEGSV